MVLSSAAKCQEALDAPAIRVPMQPSVALCPTHLRRARMPTAGRWGQSHLGTLDKRLPGCRKLLPSSLVRNFYSE